MRVIKTILAITLCVVGLLLVLFEIGMLNAEPHLFASGGWVPFSVFVMLGIVIFVGGVVILLTVLGKG
jgi:hypothetical protein